MIVIRLFMVFSLLVFLPALSGAVSIQNTFTIQGNDDVKILATAKDASGNIYVAGTTGSTNLPGTAGGAQTTPAACFVAKLSSSLSLIQTTYFGGTANDYCSAIAVDTNGNVFVAGYTSSTDLPGTAGGAQAAHGAGFDNGFVTKLNSSLTSIVRTTYFGGNGNAYIFAIALDASGNVYIAGFGASIPNTAGGAQVASGGLTDSFAAKLNNGLTSIAQATYFGGSGNDYINAIALDASGNVFVAGYARSTDLPGAAGGAQAAKGGGNEDGFIAKFNPSLTSLIQATYLGGTGDDRVNAIAMDSGGNVYAVGKTTSSDLPGTAGGVQATKGALTDSFAAKLNNGLTSLAQATYLGGGGVDIANAVLVSPSDGKVYVAGLSDSTNFPVTSDALQATRPTSMGGFISSLASDLRTVSYSSYYGSSDYNKINALVSGSIIAAGSQSVAGTTCGSSPCDRGFVFSIPWGGGTTTTTTGKPKMEVWYEKDGKKIMYPEEIDYGKTYGTKLYIIYIGNASSATADLTLIGGCPDLEDQVKISTSNAEKPLISGFYEVRTSKLWTCKFQENGKVVLKPGESCKVVIVYSPQGHAGGRYDGNYIADKGETWLSFNSNDETKRSYKIILRGTKDYYSSNERKQCDTSMLNVASPFSKAAKRAAKGGTTVDSDNDGVCDGIDDFPNDASKASLLMADGRSVVIDTSAHPGVKLTDVMNLLEMAAPNQPANTEFKYGIASFTANNVTPGGTIQVKLTYPEDIPAGSKVYKISGDRGYYEADCAAISGNTVTLTITDGGKCDDDGVADGVIVDPIGVGVPGSGAGSSSGGEGGGGGCFIATAAYGSYLDPHVDVLREFRDKYLLGNPLGKAFVAFYYRTSPPVADFIAKHESLRAAARWALTPVVYIIMHPMVSAALLVFVSGSGIAAVYRRKRKTS